MKKFSLFVMALAAIAVLGASAYTANASLKSKLMRAKEAKGMITAVDATAGTITVSTSAPVAPAEMTFKASAKLIKALKVDEKVTVGYKTLANGDNEAVYVQPAKIRAKTIK